MPLVLELNMLDVKEGRYCGLRALREVLSRDFVVRRNLLKRSASIWRWKSLRVSSCLRRNGLESGFLSLLPPACRPISRSYLSKHDEDSSQFFPTGGLFETNYAMK